MASAPHIYLSALPWLPRHTLTGRHIIGTTDNWNIIENINDEWDAILWERVVDIGLWCIAFSPDGCHVTCGGVDGLLHTWDVQTGMPHGAPLRGHTDTVMSVAYSPKGGVIVSGSYDRTVRTWDSETGNVIHMLHHDDAVLGVAMSPDGTRIASACDDGAVRQWNALTGELIDCPMTGHSKGVRCVAYSPDGSVIASGSWDSTIRTWNAQSGTPIRELRGHEASILSVSFSPDGRRLASGSVDCTMRAWDWRTGLQSRKAVQHSNIVSSVDYSSNGQLLVSGSFDAQVTVWECVDGFVAQRHRFRRFGAVMGVAFSPDTRLLASCTASGHVSIRSNSAIINSSQPLVNSAIQCMAVSPGNQHLASGHDNGNVHVWDTATGEAVGPPLQGHTTKVLALAYSSDQATLISASTDGNVRVWDGRQYTAMRELVLGQDGKVNTVAITPDGRRIISGGDDGNLRVWNVFTGEPEGEAWTGHSGPLRAIACSPNGDFFASGSKNGTVCLWTAETRSLLKRTFEGRANPLGCIAVSPDNYIIAFASGDNTVLIWTFKPDEVNTIQPFRFWQDISSLAYSTDGCLLVVGMRSGELQVLSTATYKPVYSLRAHSPFVSTSVVFSHDNAFLVSACNTVIRFYDMPLTAYTADEQSEDQRWRTACDEISNGWIKDGNSASNSLLLWVPPAYMDFIREHCRLSIEGGVVRKRPIIDVERLYRYSGARWTDIESLLDV